jgi:hypothetical protein
MPLSGGIFARNPLKASRPPAEAPMPTISRAVRAIGPDGDDAAGPRRGREAAAFAVLFFETTDTPGEADAESDTNQQKQAHVHHPTSLLSAAIEPGRKAVARKLHPKA